MESPLPPGCAARFEALKLLATGGHGVVYLARQKELARDVAIKLLQVIDNPEQVARFREEARITARLAHPNVVEIIDHEVEGGVPWIAYEYVPGAALRGRLARGALGWTEAVRIGADVAAALDAAHAMGVLHRDIKPDNVLPAEYVYKVTDFGIAKWGHARLQTRAGIIMGTPAYLSPEQCAGDPATPASDLYALGIMLFELLTGKPPYEDPNPLLVLERHVRSSVPAIWERVDGMPRALDALIQRLCAKDPSGRPGSGREVMEELATIAPKVLATISFMRARPHLGGAQPTAPISRPASVEELASASRVDGSGSAKRPPRRRALVFPWLVSTMAFGVLAGVLIIGALRRQGEPGPAASTALPSPVAVAALDAAALAELEAWYARFAQLGRDVEKEEEAQKALVQRYTRETLSMGSSASEALRESDVQKHRYEAVLKRVRALHAEVDARYPDPSPHSAWPAALAARLAAMEVKVWHHAQWMEGYSREARGAMKQREGVVGFEGLALVHRKFDPGARVLVQRHAARLGAMLELTMKRPELFDARAARAVSDTWDVHLLVRNRRVNYTEDMPTADRLLEPATQKLSGVTGDHLSRYINGMRLAAETGMTKALKSDGLTELRGMLDQLSRAEPRMAAGVQALRDDVDFREAEALGKKK